MRFTGQYNSRITIIPDAVNAVIIGRLFAFVGEICWGIQMGWAMRTIARVIPMRVAERGEKRIRKICITIGWCIPFFAIFGNIMSLTGTITKSYIFPMIEESSWACLFFFGGVCSAMLWHFGCDDWSFDWGSNCCGWDINPFDE